MKRADDQAKDTHHLRQGPSVNKRFSRDPDTGRGHGREERADEDVRAEELGNYNKKKATETKSTLEMKSNYGSTAPSPTKDPERSDEIISSVDKENGNGVIGTFLGNEGDNRVTMGSTSLPTEMVEATETQADAATVSFDSLLSKLRGDGRMSTWRNNKVNKNITLENAGQREEEDILPLLARSIRTTVMTRTTKKAGGSKRRRSNGNFPTSSSSSSSQRFSLMKTNPAPASFEEGSVGVDERKRMETSALGRQDSDYIIPPILKVEDDGADAAAGTAFDVGVSRRLLDIHQISSRLHRSFPWEGLGLHNTSSTSGIGNILVNRIGFSPNAPHTLVFSSLYVVPLILLFGIVIAIIWLLCACVYHTMQKIKLALCPGRSRREAEGESKSKKSDKKSNNKASNNDTCGGDPNKPDVLTPEIIEMRRQERLAFLQAECANLEQQLTGLRASLPPELQSSFEEKSATLTSRASDSDLEYLGASESPPLKRNSISLQDIPQSVIRIRREKELRQIKEEIEYLKSIAQQEREKVAQAAKALKGSLLITQDFELPPSKPGSPNETKVEPLSQHISHLKAQRKLTEIRTELEDLAIQLLHADEIKAKRNSLQDLPRTALNIQREQHLITMTNEIQKMKNYKLQKRNVIETALEKTTTPGTPKGAGNPSGESGKKSGSKSFINNSNGSPSTVQDAAAKYADPEFVHRSSIRRQREQELNRVRVELKDLAYKLNLNPMNYISEDRVRLVPSQSVQSTMSATGQSSSSYNRSTSTSSALNHV